jgi:enamine deaminase RidA (YjgF/YER057c/UK114 family)
VTSPFEELARLGIELPDVAAPVAAYVPAVRSGDHVHVSGQLPWRSGELIATGKVGQGVNPDQAAECAKQCALNGLAAINSVVSLERVRRIVKVVVFVASTPDFTGQPTVANGASTFLGEVFGDAGVHARSAVGVAALPLDTPVEVELVVEVEGD